MAFGRLTSNFKKACCKICRFRGKHSSNLSARESCSALFFYFRKRQKNCFYGLSRNITTILTQRRKPGVARSKFTCLLPFFCECESPQQNGLKLCCFLDHSLQGVSQFVLYVKFKLVLKESMLLSVYGLTSGSFPRLFRCFNFTALILENFLPKGLIRLKLKYY